jgi:hypothetical protein
MGEFFWGEGKENANRHPHLETPPSQPTRGLPAQPSQARSVRDDDGAFRPPARVNDAGASRARLINEGFLRFIATIPLRPPVPKLHVKDPEVQRHEAQRAYVDKVQNTTDLATAISVVQGEAERERSRTGASTFDPRFVKYPVTWLNELDVTDAVAQIVRNRAIGAEQRRRYEAMSDDDWWDRRLATMKSASKCVADADEPTDPHDAVEDYVEIEPVDPVDLCDEDDASSLVEQAKIVASAR